MHARVRAARIDTRELTQAYTLLDRFDWQPQAQVPIFAYLASPAVGEELVSLVHHEAPDVVIIDAMFSAALDAAPQFAVPTAVMVHTFARRTAPMWTMILRRQGEMRERAGFSGLPDIAVLWGERDLVHSNSLAAFDNGALPIANLRHGGPVLVEELGAGRALPNDATAADIRGTVETVLGDPSYASKAVALGTPLADLDGATLAANSVEGLLARASHDADAARRI